MVRVRVVLCVLFCLASFLCSFPSFFALSVMHRSSSEAYEPHERQGIHDIEVSFVPPSLIALFCVCFCLLMSHSSSPSFLFSLIKSVFCFVLFCHNRSPQPVASVVEWFLPSNATTRIFWGWNLTYVGRTFQSIFHKKT